MIVVNYQTDHTILLE